MDNRIIVILGVVLLLLALIPFVEASPEVIFQWEDNSVEEGKIAYIEFYQNFRQPYNFTIISDLVEECWVIKDYYSENRIICRSESGLCQSIQPLDYQYVKCKTWEINDVDNGKKAILFYEYAENGERQQGVYQTQALTVPGWTEKIVAFGPLMIALIASIVVILIILVIIYFLGNSLVSWFREWNQNETDSYEELKEVKNQITKKSDVFSNCVVIY